MFVTGWIEVTKSGTCATRTIRQTEGAGVMPGHNDEVSHDKYSTFENVEALLYDFEECLGQLGITIAKDSELGL